MSDVGGARLRRHGRAALLAAALALGCMVFFNGAARAEAKPKLLITIAQLGEPLGQMLGACADVETLLGPGVDPHLYRLTRTDTAKALAADGIIANGLNLEAQMRALFERLRTQKLVVYAGELAPPERLIRPDGVTADPHIWMDPTLWSDAIARAAAAVVDRFPGCGPAVQANQPAVLAEIADMAAYVEARIASIPAAGRVLVTAHDAFNYFGRRFDIEVLGVQGLSTESAAGVAHIRDLARVIAERRVRAVFAETSTAARAVEAVIEGARALGADVRKGSALFSDAMGAPGAYEGRYIGMLDHNATRIAVGLGGEAPPLGRHGLLAPLSQDEG